MSKEVMKQNTEVAHNDLMAEFGEAEVASTDIIIPKLLVMQGLSKAVTEGTAKFGDFVNTLSGEVVGNINDKPVEVIPFHFDKTYVVSKWNGKKFVFERIEACTPATENRPWEEVINGEKFQFVKSLNFYCVDPSNIGLPLIVSFKSTSLSTGRKLTTMMYVQNKAEGKVPCAYTVKVGGVKETKDDNTFAVLSVTKGRESTRDEVMECLKWFKVVKSGQARADHSDESGQGTPSSEANTQF